MLFISDYQLFLFDFDGLLVNTEAIHYEAYQKMCHQRGYHFPIDFSTYLRIALFDNNGIEETIRRHSPDMQKEPWPVLYEEKKRIYSELVLEKGVELMPGAERLLGLLERKKISRCLVTHSRKNEVELIRKEHPILQTIPHLITREDYNSPKPSSECYEKAIERHAGEKGRVIGFEDSPRGLRALLGSRVDAVLVSSFISLEEAKSSLPPSRPFSFFGSLAEFVEGIDE